MEKKVLNHKRRIGLSIGVMLIASFLSGLLISYICILFGINAKDNYLVVYLINAISIYAVGYGVLKLMLLKVEVAEPQEKKKLGFGRFLLIFLAAFGSAQLINFVTVIIIKIIELATGAKLQDDVSSLIQNSNPIINAIFVAVVGPVFEELIMRGTLMKRLRVYGDKTAVIYTAIAFGLFHGNIYQIPYAVALGLVFGYVMVKTNKIIYPILLHILINSIAVIMSLMIQQEVMIATVIYVLFVFSAILFSMIYLPIKLSIGKDVKVPNEGKLEKRQLYENIGYFLTVCTVVVLTFVNAVV